MEPSSHGQVSLAQVGDKLLCVLVVERLRLGVKWPSAQQPGLARAFLTFLSVVSRLFPAYACPGPSTACPAPTAQSALGQSEPSGRSTWSQVDTKPG